MQNYVYNLGQKFNEVCAKNPDKTALIYNASNECVTYQELKEISDSFASGLVTNGLTPGDTVAIFANKCRYSYGLMIACLKLGLPYVNLDHSSPSERLLKILGRVNPKLVVVIDQIISKETLVETYELVDPDTLLKKGSANIDKETLGQPTSDSIAYLMFTSGSTGFPKGAAITHQSLLNFISWGASELKLKQDDILTGVNPSYFDNSVFDFYVAIFNGLTLVPFRVEDSKNPQVIAETVRMHKPTVWFSVPSLLVYLLVTKKFKIEDFGSLQTIVFGGEGFPKKMLKKLFDLAATNGAELVNVYGPTECTCICSAYFIKEFDFEDMESLAPLGKLAPNFSFHLDGSTTNSDGEAVGELCLSGPQLALGYYNDFENTEKSFKSIKTHQMEKRFYKTGDLVKLDSKGDLHFVGRVDNQVKFMGYRIELEEIEAALGELDGVDECCVTFSRDKGAEKIVAHIGTKSNLTEEFLLERSKEKLPSYMVPKVFRFSPFLPKNQNGKIDRNLLRELN